MTFSQKLVVVAWMFATGFLGLVCADAAVSEYTAWFGIVFTVKSALVLWIAASLVLGALFRLLKCVPRKTNQDLG